MSIILFIVIIAAIVAVGIRIVPANTQWEPVFLGKRLPKRLTEGLVWLPRGVFDKIEVSTIGQQLDILAKKRDYTLPDDNAPTNEAPHQTVETILCPDGNGNGAALVYVSNVAAHYHVLKTEPGKLQGFWKFFWLAGWQPGEYLLAYTSVKPEDIQERITNVVLNALRSILGAYPYQKLTNLNLKIGDKLVDPSERLMIREEINRLLLEKANSILMTYGIVITDIPIGDLDPDPSIIAAQQALSAARLQKEQVEIANSAIVVQIEQLAKAANATLTWDLVVHAYAVIVGNANLGKAAEHGLISAEWLQKLKGLFTAKVEITTPPVPEAPAPAAPVAA